MLKISLISSCFHSQDFLKKEYSEENIVFWSKCEKFKHITDIEKVIFKMNVKR